jgi:hypothetical protein
MNFPGQRESSGFGALDRTCRAVVVDSANLRHAVAVRMRLVPDAAGWLIELMVPEFGRQRIARQVFFHRSAVASIANVYVVKGSGDAWSLDVLGVRRWSQSQRFTDSTDPNEF